MTDAAARLYARLHGEDAGEASAAAREVAAAGRPVVAVSACLLGVRCRYDGGERSLPGLDARAAGRALLPICPEVLGRLGVPRPPAAFAGDGGGDAVLAGRAGVRVVGGHDVTAAYVAGARRADELARAAGAVAAWLKERSPACGVRRVHQGDALVPGRGVFAAVLAARGIPLHSDEDLA